MQRFIVLIFLLFSQYTFSQQKQWYQWYYGNKVGLDFRTTGPTMLTNGAMNQMEGSASISDDNGALLFYTDGVTVYNKQHQVMSNGTGLKGSQSSTQSALIVPKPGDKNIYYIFTVPSITETGGLTYSEVDMRLDGGNGAVTNVKNILLLGDCYEKLAGVKHCNNRDVWVTTYLRTNNTFVSYLISPSGISTIPVISGTSIPLLTMEHTVGYIRFAPTGRRMAAAFFERGFQIFDFNNQTGILSNPITFFSLGFPANSLSPYGLEFSPDSRSLYISSATAWGGGEMLSMDLRNFDRNAILASVKQVLPWDNNREVFSLALAPDNRIYIAEKATGTYTSVLTDPDNLARPGYSTYVFGTGNTTKGLPNVIAGFGKDTVGVINTTPVCNELDVMYSFSAQITPDSVHWHFGDNTDTTRIPNGIHDYTTAGRYLVSVIRYYPCYSDTIRKEIEVQLPKVRIGNDTALCIRQPLILKGDITGTAYTWNTGSTSPELPVTRSGMYWLEVTDVNNCTTRDSINVRFKPYPALKALRDTFRCDNIPLIIDVDIQQPNALYYWQQVQHDPEISISNAGTWRVRISLEGCDTSASFNVEQDMLPRFSMDASVKMCFNDKIVLDLSQYNYTKYSWQDGSHSSAYTVTQPGKYYLETANRCGTYSDTIIVEGENCEAKFVFPTAFSPNKDGVNDLLRPVFRGNTTDYLLRVYSRWGNLVYSSTNPQQGWDGSLSGLPLPAGSYIWQLQYRSITTKEMKQQSGSVVLIR